MSTISECFIMCPHITHQHISECFIMCPHITHQHISEYSTSSTHALPCCQNLCASADTHPSYPIIFQVHYIAYPNVFLHESTCTLNIRYYPCTAHRIFATPSETFGHQFIQFFSIPNALIHISEYFYCTRMRIHAFSSLHSSINSASFIYSLKFSIDFRSIVKHSYSPPPFSEINRCLVLL